MAVLGRANEGYAHTTRHRTAVQRSAAGKQGIVAVEQSTYKRRVEDQPVNSTLATGPYQLMTAHRNEDEMGWMERWLVLLCRVSLLAPASRVSLAA